MRRFARLTNAFSKKFVNHRHMIALYAVWYNFIRIHKGVSAVMMNITSKTIRDRIVELRRVAASELVPNPRNWRRHPAR